MRLYQYDDVLKENPFNMSREEDYLLGQHCGEDLVLN